ncbi:hypothetical protein CMU93_18000 [Elizabethkingia anophelis]|nr:hypothetical protein [Elizabethkingia anophelis]
MFHTTIKGRIRGSILPTLSGGVSLVAGFYTLVVFPVGHIGLTLVFGLVFITSGLGGVVIAIGNKKVLLGWDWYFIYTLFLLVMGMYILTYRGSDLMSITGFSVAFRSALLLGISLDLKRYEHLRWSTMALAAVLGIFFSSLLLLKAEDFSPEVLISLSFISSGIASILLSLEFKKVNHFHKLMRNLSKRNKESIL